jgi:transposase-like protein
MGAPRSAWIEVITGPVLRRRWTAEEKARIVAESFAGQMSGWRLPVGILSGAGHNFRLLLRWLRVSIR